MTEFDTEAVKRDALLERIAVLERDVALLHRIVTELLEQQHREFAIATQRVRVFDDRLRTYWRITNPVAVDNKKPPSS